LSQSYLRQLEAEVERDGVNAPLANLSD